MTQQQIKITIRKNAKNGPSTVEDMFGFAVTGIDFE